MIKGIQIKNGALFVEWDGFSTYRYFEGVGWEVSPVLYMVVEWDMRTEGPDAFEYLTEGEIRALDTFDALRTLHKKTCEIVGFAYSEDEEVIEEEQKTEEDLPTIEELLSILEEENQ